MKDFNEIYSNPLSEFFQGVCLLRYEASNLGVGGPKRPKIQKLWMAVF